MVIKLLYNICINKNNKTHYNKLGYICEVGDIIDVRWEDTPSHFDIEYKCVECSNNHTSKKNILLNQKYKFTCKKCTCKIATKDRFIDLTGQKFNRLTILSFDYVKNKNYYWLTLCECGNKKSINSRSFKTGRVYSCGCYNKEITQKIKIPKIIAIMKTRTGENHPNWDPTKSNKERLTTRKYEMSVLRKKTLKRDNYTCQCCSQKGGTLNAHHILLFSKHVVVRYDLNNLITLCYTCHKQYHSKYKKNINQETLNEFKKEVNFVL